MIEFAEDTAVELLDKAAELNGILDAMDELPVDLRPPADLIAPVRSFIETVLDLVASIRVANK